MSNVIKLEATFDLDAIKAEIESSKKITGDEAYFEQLSKIQATKKVLGDIEDQLKSIEAEAKGFINSKAKALYGDNWTVIDGANFKISRSKTGDVYIINGSPASQFIKTKVSVDTKAVDKYITENKKLPKYIEVNDQRGESIKITVKSNEDS